MNKLKTNITNLFGEKGKIWLNNLPEITNKLSEIWNLSELSAYNNLSYNYVLKGFQTRENKAKKNKKHQISLKKRHGKVSPTLKEFLQKTRDKKR